VGFNADFEAGVLMRGFAPGALPFVWPCQSKSLLAGIFFGINKTYHCNMPKRLYIIQLFDLFFNSTSTALPVRERSSLTPFFSLRYTLKLLDEVVPHEINGWVHFND